MWPQIRADHLRVRTRAPRPRVAESDDGAGLMAACREAWTPAQCADPPPPWLRRGQEEPWRRLVAALRGLGGAVLAEPVGAGKTWIALAAAAAVGRRVTVIAPAVLLPQWRAAADTVLRRVHLHSLERCSRGTPPAVEADVVIVDEAHRLRNLQARCTRTVGRWIVGRPTAFLTATPIVNALSDLAALLQLLLADEALVLDGIPSLAALPSWEAPPPALGRVVIRTQASSSAAVRTDRGFPEVAREARRARRAARVIRSLALAPEAGTRRLLRSVLADAAASSDAAFHAALRRYRTLLEQWELAGGGSRALLRQFAGPDCAQGVLWALVIPDHAEGRPQLPTADLTRINGALSHPAADADWLAAVQDLLRDELPTILFCRHRATAHLLRDALGGGIAWITGTEAGIGPHRVPRDLVLRAFGPKRASWRARQRTPTVLVATDVVAEGLDLQGASRVVHLDLPWTAMRRDQRNGRVIRPGQAAAHVEVIERHPAPALVPFLDLAARVHRKGALAERWLTVLAASWPDHAHVHVTDPAIPVALPVALVALRSGCHHGAVLVVADVTAPGPIAPERLSRLLMIPPAAIGVAGADEAVVLAAAIAATEPRVAHRGLVWRCQHLARRAARVRDAASLAALDQLVIHAIRGGPLGIRWRLESLATAPDAALLVHGLPSIIRPARVTGWVVARATLPVGRDPLR